jgi:carboxypeptidase T
MPRPRAVAPLLVLSLLLAPGASAADGAAFPPDDAGFHTYAEMVAEVEQAAADHPDIVAVSTIGSSYRGRPILMAKVSDHVTVDEDEPEVLFDGLHHGDEHMTAEMTLSILALLTDGYGTKARITRLVDTREILIVFMVNPDGGEYDVRDGAYRGWRKNRQPNGPDEPKGTDLNRNYPYRWGCCGGSSADPGDRKYRGPFALSAPEARAMHDLVASRVVDGRQQIRTAITFHTQGRLIMYPYGYTTGDIPTDMTVLDRRTFVALADEMAATTGYRAIQASDLYISSGRLPDWAYGRHRIFSFTFELTAEEHPPDEAIEAETTRNHRAVLDLIDRAACPFAVVGLAASHCGPLFDDLEIDRAWHVDAAGTDTAEDGRWTRGDPVATWQDGPKQLGDAFSGRTAFVTGRAGGGCAACEDLDGGRTTVRSGPVVIPATGARLHFRGFLAHDATSDADDHLLVRIIDGALRETVLRLSGDDADRDAAWSLHHVDLAAFAGRTIRIEFEAADLGLPSLVEAGIDEIRVTAP